MYNDIADVRNSGRDVNHQTRANFYLGSYSFQIKFSIL